MSTYILLLFIFTLNSKINACDPCILINKSFQNELFQKEFYPCNDSSDTLILIDNSKVIPVNCKIDQVCSRPIKLSFTDKSDLSPEIIILYRYDNNRRKKAIYLMRPFTGAALIFRFERRKRVCSLINVEVGSF